LAVHHREQSLGLCQVLAIRREFDSILRFCRAGDVGMEVDVGKLGTLDAGLVPPEHAGWLVRRELQTRGLSLIFSRRTDGLPYLYSRSCQQTHSIQPLTPTDHIAPIVQARAPAWRC